MVIDIPKDITDPDYKFDYSYPKDINIRSYILLSDSKSVVIYRNNYIKVIEIFYQNILGRYDEKHTFPSLPYLVKHECLKEY